MTDCMTDEPTVDVKLTVSFSEMCFYETTRTFEIPLDIAHDRAAIAQFIYEMDVDELADDADNANFEFCQDREVLDVTGIHAVPTPVSRWKQDGVRDSAISAYRHRVKGPDDIWLQSGTKHPRGKCAHCENPVPLLHAAKAARHYLADGDKPCPGTRQAVMTRDQVLQTHAA